VKEDAALAVEQSLQKQQKALGEVEEELKFLLGDRTLEGLKESTKSQSKV
jgi:hypothetical protein